VFLPALQNTAFPRRARSRKGEVRGSAWARSPFKALQAPRASRPPDLKTFYLVPHVVHGWLPFRTPSPLAPLSARRNRRRAKSPLPTHPNTTHTHTKGAPFLRISCHRRL
jgi:hypothetical protein